MDKKWKVYVHIFSNNKLYFGITSKKLTARWENGAGYSKTHQSVMHNAIEKYGWENITHKVLYENLTKEEAQEIEKSLIKKYKTNCKKYGDGFGYNMTDGGEGRLGVTHSKEARRKIAEANLGRTGALCPNSVKVICDGIEYDSITEFKSKNHVKGAIHDWLNGKKGMPIEWYEKGLRYKDRDPSVIYPQKKPSRNIVIYNNKEYASQAELARELKISPATLCHWLKGKARVPQEILDKGLSIKGDIQKYKIQPKTPVIEYDSKIFTNQRELARYMGVKFGTLNAWVKGKNKIPQKFKNKGFKIL